MDVQSSLFQRISVSSAPDNRRRNSFSVQTLELCVCGGGVPEPQTGGIRLNHLFHHQARLHPPVFGRSYPPFLKHKSLLALSNTNFHSRKMSPVTAAFLRANSVCIPFRSHLWETDKTICQITLADGHIGSRATREGPRSDGSAFGRRRVGPRRHLGVDPDDGVGESLHSRFHHRGFKEMQRTAPVCHRHAASCPVNLTGFPQT